LSKADRRNPYTRKSRFVVPKKPWGRGKSAGYPVFDTQSPKAHFPGAWVYMKDSKKETRTEALKLAEDLEKKEKPEEKK